MLAILPLLAYLAVTPIQLQQPATPTSLAVADVPATLTRAHIVVFGKPPSRARLSIAIGQVRLEGLTLPGRNLGGLEYERGKAWVRVDRLTRLRAFHSYHDAAVAYFGLLAERCKGALHAMDGGDADEVAVRLKRCSYFGVPTAWYAKGLRALRGRL